MDRVPKPDDLIDVFRSVIADLDPGSLVRSAMRMDDGALVVDDRVVGSFEPDDITVVGIGKAATPMVSAVAAITGASRGLVATPVPPVEPGTIPVVIGGHPIPDEASLVAGRLLVGLVETVTAGGLLIAAVSGGGSACVEVPAAGVTLEDLVAVNRWLLSSGLPIDAMNRIRSALSDLKGGRLGARCRGTVVTLVLSDVVGGPATVASGPTIVPDEREPMRLGPGFPAMVSALIERDRSPVSSPGVVAMVGDPGTAASAARRRIEELGLPCRVVSDQLTGEAASTAVRWYREGPAGVVCIATGETTVTGAEVDGGRNHEAVAAASIEVERTGGIFAAFGTDGVDGSTGAAGAVLDARTAARLLDRWNLDTLLRSHTTYDPLAGVGASVVTGPTGTNVADLWMWMRP